MESQPIRTLDNAANAPEVAYNYTLPETVPYDLPKPTTSKVRSNRRRITLILVVPLLLVVGAIVGGTVGGIVGKSHKAGSSNSSSNGSSNGNGTNANTGNSSTATGQNHLQVLTDSKVAATNWTDAAGNDYHAVFWQAASNDLFVSLWTSETNNWTAINISASAPVTAKPGTPLAAAARGFPWSGSQYDFGAFGIALFYLSPSNTIKDVYSTDPNVATWEAGVLSSATAPTATTGSQLAAWWDLCPFECSGNLYVVYETPSQQMEMIRYLVSPAVMEAPVTWVDLIQHGSGLAIATVTPWGDQAWNGCRTPKIYYTISSRLQEAFEGSSPTASLVPGSVIANELTSTPSSISAVGYDGDNFSFGPVYLLVASVFDDGIIKASCWNNVSWTGDVTPSLLQYNGTVNFTAGAMISGANIKFYGLTVDGHINSFTVDRDAAFQWTWDPVSPF